MPSNNDYEKILAQLKQKRARQEDALSTTVEHIKAIESLLTVKATK